VNADTRFFSTFGQIWAYTQDVQCTRIIIFDHFLSTNIEQQCWRAFDNSAQRNSVDIFIWFPVRKNVRQGCVQLESFKRITYLIVGNVIDTRFEHSVAQRPFLSHSILRLTTFCAKGNGYPESFPHQPMWTSLTANQDVTARQQTVYPARRTSFFPMSYRNNDMSFGRHVLNRVCSSFENPLS